MYSISEMEVLQRMGEMEHKISTLESNIDTMNTLLNTIINHINSQASSIPEPVREEKVNLYGWGK